MPPSSACRRLPLASKTMARESACGAVPLAPLQTTLCHVFRGDAAQLPGNPWQSVVCNGANGTAPHADSRAMVFDSSGNLLHADDGGIYQLLDPDNAAGVRRWVAVNGDIRAIEL